MVACGRMVACRRMVACGKMVAGGSMVTCGWMFAREEDGLLGKLFAGMMMMVARGIVCWVGRVLFQKFKF